MSAHRILTWICYLFLDSSPLITYISNVLFVILLLDISSRLSRLRGTIKKNKLALSFTSLYELQYQLKQQAVNQNVDSNELWNKAAHTVMAIGTNSCRTLSILWWQSTLMPEVLKTHRKASFIFSSPLLPMRGQ